MLKLPTDIAERNAELITTIDDLVERHGRDRGSMLPILQELQAARGGISGLAMQLVADQLGIAPSEVQGVVTFYSFLGVGARGRHVIRLCRTLSCAMAGTAAVAAALEGEYGIPFGATTPDGAVTLEWANCLGLCDTAPALLADGVAHGSLAPELAGELVSALRSADGPA